MDAATAKTLFIAEFLLWQGLRVPCGCRLCSGPCLFPSGPIRNLRGQPEIEIAGIATPTLIMVGDGDIVTPDRGAEMFRTLPGAQPCVVPHAGCGGMPKDTILAFLQKAPTGET